MFISTHTVLSSAIPSIHSSIVVETRTNVRILPLDNELVRQVFAWSNGKHGELVSYKQVKSKKNGFNIR